MTLDPFWVKTVREKAFSKELEKKDIAEYLEEVDYLRNIALGIVENPFTKPLPPLEVTPTLLKIF